MIKSTVLGLLTLTALVGCAHRADNIVLLPGHEGQTGTLQVISPGRAPLVLDKAYQSAAVDEHAAKVELLDEKTVHERYGEVLATLPAPAERFTLYFHEGSDELAPASREDFKKIPGAIAQRPAPDIVVIGHTDTVGQLKDNDSLALRRAQKIREVMISQGLAAKSIQASGRGERELLVPTPDETPEPRNRRVEILVR